MEPFKYDIAVLLIFFNRDKLFKLVFDAVKKAKPSKLYLYQDGPRVGNIDDVIGINKCRRIVEDINWVCDVHTNYHDINLGCDPSGYYAHKWLFENEEYGIILEDDCVPSESFFPFCKELLDKYKDDERINIICGMNNKEISNYINSSYFFSKTGSIWGWATWRRVAHFWDEHYNWLNDKNVLSNIKNSFKNNYSFKQFIKNVKKHIKSGKNHFESIEGIDTYLYNRLNIIPKYNMITNIGIDSYSTHAPSNIEILPKRVQSLFYMKRYEIAFPLIHPKYVIEDAEFANRMSNSLFKYCIDKLESFLRIMVHHIRIIINKYYFGTNKFL